MPISPSDLLRLAHELAQNEGNEAHVRSAVSRAYYAGLHATRQTFAGRERMGNESSHAEIIGRATAHSKGMNPGRSAAAQIALQLSKLRRLRNAADYDISEPFLRPQDCQAALLRAQEVLRLCQEVTQKVAESQR
ncbi:MAG: hypothetical protein RLZZ352_2725 [Pseudomonadota bacterium]|jgi:uncharacterized protein (UPF0332 family)